MQDWGDERPLQNAERAGEEMEMHSTVTATRIEVSF